MTDAQLIDEMARAICCPDKERRCDQDWSCDAMEKYGDKARAALAVAKKELFERAAQEAVNEGMADGGYAHPKWTVCANRIAARIRSLAAAKAARK